MTSISVNMTFNVYVYMQDN